MRKRDIIISYLDSRTVLMMCLIIMVYNLNVIALRILLFSL